MVSTCPLQGKGGGGGGGKRGHSVVVHGQGRRSVYVRVAIQSEWQSVLNVS